MIVELDTLGRLRSACGDDDLVVWVAQGLGGGFRAWASGDAVVAAGPGVSRRDRLAVWGGTAAAASLVRHALAELGPSYRPLGDAGLVRAVSRRVPGLRVAGEFLWMSQAPAAGASSGFAGVPELVGAPAHCGSEVGWLAVEEEPEVAEMLAREAPGSYAVPGIAGVRRWAGIRLDGALAAVAADAWSAPSVGLLAGVATDARFRGRGLAARVCGWVTQQLLARHGRAALMVDGDNPAAITVYERLGYRPRPVAAAALT